MTVTVNLPNELEQKVTAIPAEKRDKFFLNAIKGQILAEEYQKRQKKRYSPEVQNIYKQAKKEAEKLKKQGITREQAFDMLDKSMNDISEQLNANSGE